MKIRQFWKPIEKCPKEDGKLYFIMTKYGTVLTGRYEHEINEIGAEQIKCG